MLHVLLRDGAGDAIESSPNPLLTKHRFYDATVFRCHKCNFFFANKSMIASPMIEDNSQHFEILTNIIPPA